MLEEWPVNLLAAQSSRSQRFLGSLQGPGRSPNGGCVNPVLFGILPLVMGVRHVSKSVESLLVAPRIFSPHGAGVNWGTMSARGVAR